MRLAVAAHEPKLAARCPRAVRLSDGNVVADGPGREVAMGNYELPPVVQQAAGGA